MLRPMWASLWLSLSTTVCVGEVLATSFLREAVGVDFRLSLQLQPLSQDNSKLCLSNSYQKPLFPALCFAEHHGYEHSFIV